MNGDPYGLTALLYDPLVELAARDIRRACMRIYTPPEGIAVLDVGCGTGTQLQQYQRARCRVSGIDASTAMLDRARMKLGESADLCLGTATRLPYADGSFGLVTCVITLHEMPPSQRGIAGVQTGNEFRWSDLAGRLQSRAVFFPRRMDVEASGAFLRDSCRTPALLTLS